MQESFGETIKVLFLSVTRDEQNGSLGLQIFSPGATQPYRTGFIREEAGTSYEFL
ncbi:hypothetical protein CFII64_29139 [Pseudomonas sp. CFII64]|nr:hypothetical protein CFII64_29139 [Pseudomonas sp. CFII64]